MSLHDYKGCFHIHSTYSDGDYPIPEILDAARDAGLDYIVLTDHNTLAPRDDGWEAWHDGVLLAVGTEIETGEHHCMALGIDELDVVNHKTTAERLAAIKRQGGLAFVAHPKAVRRKLFKVDVPGWDEWDLPTFDGIEIWPYLHDWIGSLHIWNFLSHYRHPDRWIRGPAPDLLREWDAIGRRRRVVGIGSLDNHARRFPRRWNSHALLEIFPHRQAFRTVRTHVLAPEPFTGQADADLRQLYALLSAGRCYVSYDLLADATGFLFEGRRRGAPVAMGDELPAGDPVHFSVQAPAEAEIRLLRDGEPVAEATGRTLAAADGEPGVYRVEAFLGGRPWIFSNPIYLRQPSAATKEENIE